MITLYGIPNCDTVKKARSWFTERGVQVYFYDFKKQGLRPELVEEWLQNLDWQVLLNRKGSTWRNLSDVQKNEVVDAKSAAGLICTLPSLVKRPVVNWGSKLTVGFDAKVWESML